MSNQTAPAARQSIPHLLEEPPISVYPSLAVIFGVNTAIVLQQLHFLLNVTKRAKSKYNYVDDCWWVYNTYKEWQEDYFPWLSPRTIQRCFLELETAGIVKSRQSVKHKSDRTKWYSIDYPKCIAYLTKHTQRAKMAQSNHDDNLASSNVQNRHDGYTENTPETTTENTAAPNGAGSSSPSPNGKKPETPKRKRKTNKQQWLERLEPVSSLVHILLGKLDEGYARGIFTAPAEYMTVAHLEKYVPGAEELREMGATPEKVGCVYDWIKPQYDAKKWPVGVKTIVEKYRTWEITTAAKPAAAPVQDAYSAWRAQTMADELGGI